MAARVAKGVCKGPERGAQDCDSSQWVLMDPLAQGAEVRKDMVLVTHCAFSIRLACPVMVSTVSLPYIVPSQQVIILQDSCSV